ncbi:MAG TPA: hypothetical protein VJU61_09655 [Polyangiaceae bacterium]|nr:hypothetical protein [Polyangiaceae bacterium]
MSRLLACPFCRELFEAAEAEQCPECEIALAPLESLPPSFEVLEEEAARWEQNSAEDAPRAWFDLGVGRGLLLGIALASLLSFWLAPWVDITSPNTAVRSGYSLARGPIGWLWGGAVAWGVSLALVASRRSMRQMRGVRPILMLFAAMTASEITLLLCLSPRGSPSVHYAYQWAWGLYASLALSLAGVVAASRFGGSPAPVSPPPARLTVPERPSLLH